MKLLPGLNKGPFFANGTVATIGNFDGVHLGHQALLAALRAQADKVKLPVVVLLFEPQPGEYFHGQQAPARLTSLREKLQVLKACKVDYVYCLKFNENLALMAAPRFAKDYFFSLLHVKYLLVGEDFHFGHGRMGDVHLLKEMGDKTGCIVQTFPDFSIENNRVSSTKIRDALSLGQLQRASEFLGRTFSLCGRVIKGDGRGRQWGIPTANLSMQRTTLPLKGVFCVQVCRAQQPNLTNIKIGISQRPLIHLSNTPGRKEGGENSWQAGGEWLQGVANLGSRPTVDGTKNILEIHLFDFDESLYGEMLQVFFLHKLRDEVKFSSMAALFAQIHDDIAAAKAKFHAQPF